ncbi:MAG: hypothetical protein ACRD1K_05000 [Acidimicrobiales bacterium]
MNTGSHRDPVALVFAAPVISPGESWRERSLVSWRILAGHHGITAEPTDEGGRGFPGTWCGNVAIEGILYRVHRAPRLRVAVVSGGDRFTWALHSATYAEPVTKEVEVLDPRDDLRYPGGYPDLGDERLDIATVVLAGDRPAIARDRDGPEPAM